MIPPKTLRELGCFSSEPPYQHREPKLLADYEIEGLNMITPYNPADLQPCSYDVHLAFPLHKVTPESYHSYIDPERGHDGYDLEQIPFPTEWYVLPPGELLLACTQEYITLPPNIAGRIEGVSSLGRLGLNIYQTCGLLDPGWEGRIVLEVSTVAHNIMLRPGMRIAQVLFTSLGHNVRRPYQGKYQRQHETIGARGN